MPDDGFLTAKQESLLNPEELREYVEVREAFHVKQCRETLNKFARYIQVPGAPQPDSSATSDIAKFLAEKRGEVIENTVSDTADLYPKLLEPAAHHDLTMTTLQGLVEEDIIAPDGFPIDGVMFMMPPASAKSTYSSMIAPGYFMGKWSNFNVIVGSYSQGVANRFSRRAKSIVGSESYRNIFPDVSFVKEDVENWELSNGSEFRSAGIQASVTSYRANLFIVDDPVAGREEAELDIISEKTWQSYNDEIVTRLKPGGLGKICLIMTRWSENDLAGRILGEEWKGQSGHWVGTDEKNWYIVSLPRVAEHADDPMGRTVGELLWPGHFTWRETNRLQKAAEKGGTAARTWASLHQQRPAPTSGNILLREYWRKWTKTDAHGDPQPPECDFILMSYDTAIEAGEENDYSAMTAWGTFAGISTRGAEQFNHPHVILLGAWRDKIQAVDLADAVEEQFKYFRKGMTISPTIIVEKRASGHQLIQELRRRGLPVKSWLPKGKPGALGKIPRAHGVSMMLEQGSVHYIPGEKTQAVIDECAAFPNGSYDDWVDTVTSALTYMRDHFWFRTADEEMEEEERKEFTLRQRRNRRSRRLYGTEIKAEIDDSPWENLTEDTRRRLYGSE